jgi:very-short-patch-repair endonuclease
MLDVLGVSYETQVFVEGVGWVDFLVEGWLAIEGDGYEFHRDRESYRNDRRRGNRLVEGRLTVLRFSWEDVHLSPMRTLAQIAAVLEHRP